MKDFLAILLTAKDDNGVGLTPLEIRNEVDTFLFEGTSNGQKKIPQIFPIDSNYKMFKF